MTEKNNFFALSAVIVTMLVMGTACQKDEVKITNENFTKNTISDFAINDSILTIDRKRMEWIFSVPKRKTLSKGYMDELVDIETATVYYNIEPNNKQYQYKAIKVPRQSDSTKYFYVMIENLGVPTSKDSWYYGDDVNNGCRYGRLYTWEQANKMGKSMRLTLPVYDKKGNVLFKNNKVDTLKCPVTGRLINTTDYLDIINCAQLPTPEETYTLDDANRIENNVYDAFVFGIEDAEYNEECAFHTMGGMRNTACQPEYPEVWIKGWYIGLNIMGRYWLAEGDNDAHHFFAIERRSVSSYVGYDAETDYNFGTYVAAPGINKFGYSVRYVFEPIYRNK